MDTVHLAETKSQALHLVYRPEGAKPSAPPVQTAVDPNDLIDMIIDALNYAELAHDAQGYVKARRLLNNDLRQAIDEYIEWEVQHALGSNQHRSG